MTLQDHVYKFIVALYTLPMYYELGLVYLLGLSDCKKF